MNKSIKGFSTGGEMAGKVSLPAGGKGVTLPCNPVGKPPGSPVPGFTKTGLKSHKV